jgi:hypothetical protein
MLVGVCVLVGTGVCVLVGIGVRVLVGIGVNVGPNSSPGLQLDTIKDKQINTA